jgi:hypothetical protein
LLRTPINARDYQEKHPSLRCGLSRDISRASQACSPSGSHASKLVICLQKDRSRSFLLHLCGGNRLETCKGRRYTLRADRVAFKHCLGRYAATGEMKRRYGSCRQGKDRGFGTLTRHDFTLRGKENMEGNYLDSKPNLYLNL